MIVDDVTDLERISDILRVATGEFGQTKGYLVGVRGSGLRVALDVAQTGASGSAGEFGWAGAAKTHYWVDPVEQVVGVFMTQSMSSFDLPELDLRALAYGAIVDQNQ
jgi:CubicO group peptidase (beta-lactamase class C family)